MEKKKLLVSFSGGETSAFMAQWLWNNKQDEFDMVFVFANTGQENEETLEFVEKCSAYFGFPVVWVESEVHYNQRKGTTFKIVDFKSASRDGQPFEDVIKKYGIPNQSYPHCTRELKEAPIHKYTKSLGWSKYLTAIGIRNDEADRMNSKYKSLGLIYPLITMRPMTKPKINLWWSQQPFRLRLKGYQGNCKWCWKKGDGKLFKIAQENIGCFDFPKTMEERYGNYIPESRLKLMKDREEQVELPINFFRKNRSVEEIVNEAKNFNRTVTDDAQVFDYELDLFDLLDLDGESCEVFSQCGS